MEREIDVRKLATIARIENIEPIPEADLIECATIRGWKIVTRKGEFNIGDLCVYVEIGSILPDGLSEELRDTWNELNKNLSKTYDEELKITIKEKMSEIVSNNTRPEFEFLRGNKFLIKSRRIRNCISQGIIFPTSIIPMGIPMEEGFDLTNILGVVQYFEPESAVLGGDAKGSFPFNQLKTDEERIENLSGKYEKLREYRYYVSEKIEGSSGTYYIDKDEFGVCSHNQNLKENSENTFWKVARKLNIEEKMRTIGEKYGLKNFNLQGEVCGEGIQKNIYKIKGHIVLFFAAFDIDNQEYLEYEKFIEMISEMGLETVPIVDSDFELPENKFELLEKVDEFKTMFGNTKGKILSEGWVLVAKNPKKLDRLERCEFGRISFKVKSRTYAGKY